MEDHVEIIMRIIFEEDYSITSNTKTPVAELPDESVVFCGKGQSPVVYHNEVIPGAMIFGELYLQRDPFVKYR